MARKPTTRELAVRFFYHHAGYGYDPKTETKEQGKRRGARALARAEQAARERGWSVTWEDDADADPCWNEDACDKGHMPHSHECLQATLYDADGDMLASLGGIYEPSRDYTRVVEAELASEALDRAEQARAAFVARTSAPAWFTVAP